MRLDTYDTMPKGLQSYLSYYGWHFNKKLCDFAISKMKDSSGNKISSYNKETVDLMLKHNNIELVNDCGYDCVFVANMAKSDYFGSSITDEAHLSKFIKDYIDDPDGYDGLPMTRFFADIIGKGITIEWEDML